MVLRAFREHSNQTLPSHHSILVVCYFLAKHLSHTTGNLIGYSGAESISRALQSNTSLKSLDISGVPFCFMYFNTKITLLEILVLRAFREHFNQTLHSHHLLFQVCRFVHMYFNTTVNQIGDSGAESISRALQSNTSCKYLYISCVCCFILMFHTTGNFIGDSGAESISRALQSNTSLKSQFQVCCVIHMFHTTGNHIGDSGAESISRALQSNTSLTSLTISCVLFC